jgi:predicted ATPase/DNA-binding SARP family transcriptional activator
VSVRLTLLDGVRWDGAPVVGERSKALLAALVRAGGRAVRADRLVEEIWGDDEPVNPAKALQVVVSRTRAATVPDAVVRDGEGYRLGLEPGAIDATRLAALTAESRAALASDPAVAAEKARGALALGASLTAADPDDDGPLADLRRAAAAELLLARRLLAQASGRGGAHGDALPALEAAVAEDPDDESLLADLLRSEAVVRGPGAALERYERHRRDLLARLGTNPGEALRRVHRDLLALDRPVRTGVRYDATALLGRDRDVARLRALLAENRVVSIVGPGGLGKTRLAHVLARDTAFPVVHVVELVGVTAPEDLIGELGSALGVRDSVTSRRTLTPEQRADVRARIAQALAQTPGLLVLDNCEHLVRAVAELVAFLVSATADLRIVTTSRAPLAIGAERVYALGTLGRADALELFRQRAVAARPGVALDDAVVTDVVTRLDGLPLAIELAAAKVRAMAVEEIDRRLEDRFALLRGGDRSAPDRHRTLLAVIDWSWNLLGEPERRALRRLALFHDGFTLEGADAVLGGGALQAVGDLVDQSLLRVEESALGVRYRMLETVREFGRMQLAAVGEEDEARAAQRAWATALADRHRTALFGRGQLATIDALAQEDSNLADELRAALADGDAPAVVRLLPTLGGLWMIRGEHERLMALTAAISDVLGAWSPPPELRDVTRAAVVMALANATVTHDRHAGPLRALLARVGSTGSDPRTTGMARVLSAYEPGDDAAFRRRIEELTHDPDRHTALTALIWANHFRENGGDPEAAIAGCRRALELARDDDGPWAVAGPRTQLAGLAMQVGDRSAAVEHARAALPVLERLGARDDVVQLRALLVLNAITDGRLDEAERELSATTAPASTVFGGLLVAHVSRAELLLARGDRVAGLDAYRRAVDEVRSVTLPGLPRTGLDPWVLLAEATALAAFAHHASTPAEEECGEELFAECRRRIVPVLERDHPHLDYPVAGIVLFALAAWGLLRDALPADDAVRLLVLADRFAYHRSTPTMAWERLAPRAEEVAPGRIATMLEEYGDRRGPALLDGTRGLLERLNGVRSR